MRRSVFFLVNIIAPYNIPFFNRISKGLNNDVYFFFDSVKESNRKWNVLKEEIKFDYSIENSFNISWMSKAGNDAPILRTVYFPYYIIKRIATNKPKVVLSIEFGLRTIFSLLMCKITSSKLIVVSDVTPISESNVGAIKLFIRRFIVKNSDGAIARSYNAKKYLKLIGFNDSKLIVAPYAIEPTIIDGIPEHLKVLTDRIKEKRENKFCFIFSGHFTKLKGLDLLIKISDKLPGYIKKHILFILAGGNEEDLNRISKEYNKEQFFPIGFIDNKDLPVFYRLADCFILPTRSDTWALVVNEALEANCPVMISKYAGCANELIEDNKTGIVFDPLNETEFLEKLIFAFYNRQTLKTFAERARSKLSEYNNDVAADRVINMIKKLT